MCVCEVLIIIKPHEINLGAITHIMTFDLRTSLTCSYCSNGAQSDFALLKENAVILIDCKIMEVIDK